MKRITEFWMFYFPLPLFILVYYLMRNLLHANDSTLNQNQLIAIIVIPVIYGYLIPYISVNIMKKWEFTRGMRIGGIYVHQGFKIASHLLLWLYLILKLVSLEQMTIEMLLIASVFCGFAQGFSIWIHDILAMRYGYLIMFNQASLSGKGAEVVVFKFAPATFFTLGFTYSFSSLLILKKYFAQPVYVQAAMALLLIIVLVSLVYKICEKSLNRA